VLQLVRVHARLADGGEHVRFVLALRAVLVDAVFDWSDTILVQPVLILRRILIVLLLDLTLLLLLFIVFLASLLVERPLTMELAHSMVPVALFGADQVPVILPPVLPFLLLALLPVFKAHPVRLGYCTPRVPLVLEAFPSVAECLLDTLEDPFDGRPDLLEPVLEAILWTWVYLPPGYGYLRW